MTRLLLMVAVALLLAVPSALAGDAQLVEDKALDLGKFLDDAPGKTICAARLSPDGQYLLYAKAEKVDAKPEGYTGSWDGKLYRLFLRDLATGKDKAIPAPAFTRAEPLEMMLSRNLFGAENKKIVLGIGATATEGGIFDERKGTMKPAIYDVAAGTLETLPLEGQIVVPMFHRNGKDLLISVAEKGGPRPPTDVIITPADKLQPRKVAIGGIPYDMCPTADVVPVLTVLDRDAADGKRQVKFRLFDLAAGKVIAELPLGSFDEWEECPPRWTSDGRFLCYFDDRPGGPATGGKSIMRIWDCKEGQHAGWIERAIPVGPGRGGSEMVMLCKEGKTSLSLHDPATGKNTDLTAAGARIESRLPLTAGGGRVVYVRGVPPDKIEYRVAKIEAEAAGAPPGQAHQPLAGLGQLLIRKQKSGETYAADISRLQWTADSKAVVFDLDAWHHESYVVDGLGTVGKAPDVVTRRRAVMLASVETRTATKLADGAGCWLLPGRGLVAYLEPRRIPAKKTATEIIPETEAYTLYLHDLKSGSRTSVCDAASGFAVSPDEAMLSYRSEGREYLAFIDKPTKAIDLSEKMKPHAPGGYWSKQWTKDGALFIRAQTDAEVAPTWLRFDREKGSLQKTAAPPSAGIRDWDKEITYWDRQKGRPSPDGKWRVNVKRQSTTTTKGTIQALRMTGPVTFKAEIDNLVLIAPDGRETPLTDLSPPWE